MQATRLYQLFFMCALSFQISGMTACVFKLKEPLPSAPMDYDMTLKRSFQPEAQEDAYPLDLDISTGRNLNWLKAVSEKRGGRATLLDMIDFVNKPKPETKQKLPNFFVKKIQ